jgi:hypothetical protein
MRSRMAYIDWKRKKEVLVEKKMSIGGLKFDALTMVPTVPAYLMAR